jgi:TRAP-type C4-dicarboxylate transport system substrate-binding protein
MNPRAWSQIAPADQAIVRQISRETTHRAIPYLRGVVGKAQDEIKQKGGDVYVLNDTEMKATRQQMQSVFDRIAAISGDAGKAVAEVMKPYW